MLPTVSALREHGDALVEQVLAENAGRWESASPRDLARVEAIARAVDEPPAARAHDPPAQPVGGARPRQPRARARAVRAARRRSPTREQPTADIARRRQRAPRLSRTARASGSRSPAGLMSRWAAHRHPRQRARARPGRARRRASWRRPRRDRHDRRRAATARRDARRQVALGRHDRGRRCSPARSTSPCTPPRTSPASSPSGPALLGAPARGAARGRAVRRAPSLEDAAPRARASARAACAAPPSCAPRARISRSSRSAATSTRACVGSREGEFDAIVLARAGLQRLGREGEIGAVLDPARFVPAPGQGALALEGRAGDDARAARRSRRSPTPTPSPACTPSARVARALDATCHTPLGAHATPAGCGCLSLRAWVGLPDGSGLGQRRAARRVLRRRAALGRRVAERMTRRPGGERCRRGGDELLRLGRGDRPLSTPEAGRRADPGRVASTSSAPGPAIPAC